MLSQHPVHVLILSRVTLQLTHVKLRKMIEKCEIFQTRYR